MPGYADFGTPTDVSRCAAHGASHRCGSDDASLHRRRGAGPRLLTEAWARSGLAIGVVEIASALGVVVGLALDSSARVFWPAAGRATVAVLVAALGHSLGWWWYATVGQRWMAGDG